jgi:two-component system OmpR family sensor kinase
MRRLYVKIMLYVVAVLVVGVAAVFLIFWVTRPARVGQVVREHVLALATHFATDLQEGRGTAPGDVQARLTALAQALRVSASLRDASGSLVASAGPELPPPAPEEVGKAGWIQKEQGLRTLLATVPYPGGGTLRIAPLGAIFESRLTEHLALLAGLALLVCLLLYPLARLITRPLRELEEVARAIAGGDLSSRARVRTRDEIGSLGRAFNHMAEQIALSIRQEKELTAAVSHELRAPLSRIRLAVELLAGAPGHGEVERQHLEGIVEEISALDSLIEELLTRARLESAAFELALEPCDLKTIVNDAVRRAGLPDDLGASGRIEMSLPAEPLRLRANPTLLSGALRNLIENALQYSPRESPVRVEAFSEGTFGVVRVQDQGPGIPAEEVPRIFEPFFRGERSRSRRTGGVGLGLTLARLIVHRHGGEIVAESELGRGTRITVRLPSS